MMTEAAKRALNWAFHYEEAVSKSPVRDDLYDGFVYVSLDTGSSMTFVDAFAVYWTDPDQVTWVCVFPKRYVVQVMTRSELYDFRCSNAPDHIYAPRELG